ncbi:MAG: amidohydrolase family protein [Vicinamibacterales bacterium]
MIRYRAAWVLPVAAPPVRNGWVDADAGRIVAVGGADAPAPAHPVHDLGSVALMPGLVNAHTHLELSHLRHQIPASDRFVAWVRGVMASRRARPNPSADEILDGIRMGIDEALRCGTVLVGDISNTLVPYEPLADSALAATLFYELIRFNAPDPNGLVSDACVKLDALAADGHVRTTLAAHAPYSVAPSVFTAIRAAMDRWPDRPCSVHLAESREESEFIAEGTGEWRTFLEQVGSWDPAWTPPRLSPVAALDSLSFLTPRTLAVHGVQMSADDLACLAARGTTLVTCPRSNAYTGAGQPPIAAFYASGVRVAVGTDSLASTPDLNVFAELAAMRALAPGVPAAALIESATVQGARALGFAADFGTLEPGRRARMLAVSLPADASDVEEYLVSGIEPSQVCWITDSDAPR